MKYLIKNLGILMIIAAVVVLAIYSIKDIVDNVYLIVSLALLIGGIIVHIVANRFVEE